MIVFVIILFGLVIKTSYRNPNFKNNNYLFLFLSIIIIHVCAFLINHFYIEPIDSKAFYQRAINAQNWFSLFGIGSKSMSFVIYPLTQCGFNFLSLSLLCSIISLKGYFIYLELVSKKLKNIGIYHISIFLFFIYPSIHIWTTSLYKESILFTLMAVILKEIQNEKLFNFKLIFSLILITLIRPYISLFIVLAIILIYHKVIVKEYKIISLFVISIITFALVNFLKVYNLSSYKSHFEKIINYSSNNGNSSIDLLNSNYFERLFLVLFRPFFFDSKTLFQFFVSIENFVFIIILIILSFKIYKQKPKFSLINKHVGFMLLFSITCILFYSIYMYNLGLASRMRVMFIPFLLIGMFNLLSLKKI